MQVSQPLACSGHQHADEEKHKSPPCISVQVAKQSPVSSCKDGLNLILSRHVGQPPEHGCICTMTTQTQPHSRARSTAADLELNHILRGDVIQLPEHGHSLIKIRHLGQASIAHLQPQHSLSASAAATA